MTEPRFTISTDLSDGVLAVDDDPQSGAIARFLVQEVNGELRRLAPGTYQLVDAVVVITAARELSPSRDRREWSRHVVAPG